MYSCKLFAQQNQLKCGWKELSEAIPFQKASLLQEKNHQFAKIRDNNAVYILPVVVHVIHTGTAVGAADNPTNAQINALISNLNKSFRKQLSTSGGADMRIQFKLAIRSPNCTSTTGINRVDGSVVANYATGGITNYNYTGSADEKLVKNLSRWPNTDYINIWIVNKINGNASYPGGYAYFPEYNSAAIDGLVLQASVVNGTNSTIVHEMGHFLNLYHTFYDGAYETTCASNTDCANEGDKVCDTEVHLNVPCSTTTNGCNSNSPFVMADTTKHYTVQNNYMGYTDCQYMFTAGQKTRARAALFSFRYGLVTSKALTAPVSGSVVAACTPSATNGLSPYYGVQKVELNTLSVYSHTSMADGAFYIDRSCNQSTQVIMGQTYTLSVAGCYGNPHRIKVFIDYNNDGDFSDSNETVLSTYKGAIVKQITIPVAGVVTGMPLRMRVVADNPALPNPTACQLHGTAAEGAGQIEDYAVIVLPPTPIVKQDYRKERKNFPDSF